METGGSEQVFQHMSNIYLVRHGGGATHEPVAPGPRPGGPGKGRRSKEQNEGWDNDRTKSKEPQEQLARTWDKDRSRAKDRQHAGGHDQKKTRGKAHLDKTKEKVESSSAAGDIEDGEASDGSSSGRQGSKGDSAPKLRRNKWINRQVTRIANTGNLNRLLQTIQYHILEMNAINLVTALHRVTKLAASGPEGGSSVENLLKHPSFKLLSTTVIQRIEAGLQPDADGRPPAELPFEVQCMSIVCWSCATLRLQEERLMTAIADLALPRIDELKPFELSNMVWAYAKLNMGTLDFFKGVSQRMMARVPGEFSLQCLSMVAWSFATAKRKDPALFSSLAAEIVGSAVAAKPQEIANTLWAYAKSRSQEVALFTALGDAALDGALLWKFKPQELSNTVWAFATIGLQHPPLFRKALAVAVSKRRQLSLQNSANILWAYAKLQVCRRSGLFPAIFSLLSNASGECSRHKPQEISAILWAAAREDFPACQRLGSPAAREVAGWIEKQPAEILEPLLDIGLDAPALYEYLVPEVEGPSGAAGRAELKASSNLFRGLALALQPLWIEVAQDPAALRDPAIVECRHRYIYDLNTICMHLLPRLSAERPPDLRHLAQSASMLPTDLVVSVPALSRLLTALGQAMDLDTAPAAAPLWSATSMAAVHAAAHAARNSTGLGLLPALYDPAGLPDPAGSACLSVVSDVLGGDDDGEDLALHRKVAEDAALGAAWSSSMPSFTNAFQDWGEASAAWTPWTAPGSWTSAAEALGSPTLPASRASIPPPPGIPVPPESTCWWPRSVDCSCLVKASGEEWTPVDLFEEMLTNALLGTGDTVVRLRCGVVDERVVVKRASAASGAATWPASLASARHILPPCARIVMPPGRASILDSYIAYRYCSQGSLAEWVTASGRSDKDLARAMLGMLGAAAALLEAGEALQNLCAEELFVDEAGDVHLRLRLGPLLDGSIGGFDKWQSPEEVAGMPAIWPCAAFRIGLALYCLGTGSSDPYPHKSAELVAVDLKREAQGTGKPVRPDMQKYRGSDEFKELLLRCLNAVPTSRPTMAELQAFARERVGDAGAQGEEMRFCF